MMQHNAGLVETCKDISSSYVFASRPSFMQVASRFSYSNILGIKMPSSQKVFLFPCHFHSHERRAVLYLVLKRAAFTAIEIASKRFPPHSNNWGGKEESL